jgi:hypothetical protein
VGGQLGLQAPHPLTAGQQFHRLTLG